MTPSHIIVHHSLTKDSQTVSWSAIRQYHTATLGWRDIGYHYGIELVSSTYEILVGRMLDESGAHTRQEGMNRKSIGICCVGNFDGHKPNQHQWYLCLKLTASLMEVFNIPVVNVHAHREFASYKSCPGTLWDMDTFREDLQKMRNGLDGELRPKVLHT